MTFKQEKIVLLRGIKTLQHRLAETDMEKKTIEFMELHSRYMNLVDCLLDLEFRAAGQRETDG